MVPHEWGKRISTEILLKYLGWSKDITVAKDGVSKQFYAKSALSERRYRLSSLRFQRRKSAKEECLLRTWLNNQKTSAIRWLTRRSRL